MTDFTSVQSGNFNDAATWGGGGFPSSGADTAVISATHVVTVPTGTTSSCGLVTLNPGTNFNPGNFTSLTIDGTFNMAGNIVPQNATELRLGPGAVLDLNGNNVSPTNAGGSGCQYNFHGADGNRASIQSTGTAGRFTAGPVLIGASFRHVNVSGLGDSALGRGNGAAISHE